MKKMKSYMSKFSLDLAWVCCIQMRLARPMVQPGPASSLSMSGSDTARLAARSKLRRRPLSCGPMLLRTSSICSCCSENFCTMEPVE